MGYRHTFSVFSFLLISLVCFVGTQSEAEHQNSFGAFFSVLRAGSRGRRESSARRPKNVASRGRRGDPNRAKADKPLEYQKQATESIQKGLDGFNSGVKALGDSFKQSLDSVSKLAPDNQDAMKSLRSSVDAIDNSGPVGGDSVAQITGAIDKDGQTQVDITTKKLQAFSYGPRSTPNHIQSGGPSVEDKAKSLNRNSNSGLSLASSASVPGGTQLPEIGKGGGYGNYGSAGRGSHGSATGIETIRREPSSILEGIDFSLEGTYNPPSVSVPNR